MFLANLLGTFNKYFNFSLLLHIRRTRPIQYLKTFISSSKPQKLLKLKNTNYLISLKINAFTYPLWLSFSLALWVFTFLDSVRIFQLCSINETWFYLTEKLTIPFRLEKLIATAFRCRHIHIHKISNIFRVAFLWLLPSF